MYTLKELIVNKEVWKDLDVISAKCGWCGLNFEIKHGTLYNIIRRNACGIYCGRKCSGSARSHATQKKYENDGGKECKRCGEFKELSKFSPLPNPPYLRAECKRCHNYKPARQYGVYKGRANRNGVEFKLSLDDFLNLSCLPCFYCGDNILAIRVELINNNVGFLNGNVITICRGCQKFRGETPHEDFIDRCYKITKNISGEK